jgi:phosphomannomutase
LIARVACEIIEDDAEPSRPGEPSRAVLQSSAIRAPGAARPAAPTARRLGRRTLAAGADFGLWIDGDGEAAVVVDERGREVPPERLLLVLARHLQSEQPGAAIVIEPSPTHSTTDELLGVLDHASLAADATRRGMAAAMAGTQAVLGGGSSGRYWLPPSPAPDALHLVALLLTLLSRRDWPLSEVIARSLEPAGSYL